MSVPRLSSNPHIRDLIGIGSYLAGMVLVAVTVYAGLLFVAPFAADRAVQVSHAIDRWSDHDVDDDARLSNFQRWLEDQKASHQASLAPKREPMAGAEPQLRQAYGVTGIAAAAKAKALAEMGHRRTVGNTRPRRNRQTAVERDHILPRGARPAEQTGFVPPQPHDKHRVY
jgi:hypothetical protein